MSYIESTDYRGKFVERVLNPHPQLTSYLESYFDIHHFPVPELHHQFMKGLARKINRTLDVDIDEQYTRLYDIIGDIDYAYFVVISPDWEGSRSSYPNGYNEHLYECITKYIEDGGSNPVVLKLFQETDPGDIF